MANAGSLTADTQDAYADLKRFAKNVGLPFELRSARRTCQQQDGLYAIGREFPGEIVTNARGCKSWHVLGRAFDITIPGAPRSDYRTLGEYWESLGGHWGGRFTGLDDPGHFEWHPGLTIEDVCPNPSACETTVERHLAESAAWAAARVPWGEVLAVAGISAAAMIWWMD